MSICSKAETGFETRQVRRLFMRFNHLDRSNKGYLEKSDLLVLKEVSDEKFLIQYNIDSALLPIA